MYIYHILFIHLSTGGHLVSGSRSVSCSVVSHSFWPHELYPARFLCPWNSPGQSAGVGCHSLLQGLNPGLWHCRQILYLLNHQGSPGHLSCFHILATVNSGAMNIGIHVSFQISVFIFFWYMYPGVKLLGHMVVLFLVFWETAILFSTVAVFLPTVYKGSCSPRLPQYFLSVFFFYGNFPDRCEVMSHCGILICISLIFNHVEHLFINLLVICMSSLKKCLFRSSAFLKQKLYLFLAVLGLSCGMWDLWSLLWHERSVVVAWELLVEACRI